MRAREIYAVLDRLARRPRSGVRRVPAPAIGEPRYSIDFRAFDSPPPPDVRCTVLGHPWRAGLVRAVPGCPGLFGTSEYVGARPSARLCWVVRLRSPAPRPPARVAKPPRPRPPLPLARLAALIHQLGPIPVVAVGGDADTSMTLTAGRIVLDLSGRPIYAWAEVREVADSPESMPRSRRIRNRAQ
jgi:hypothetical protein